MRRTYHLTTFGCQMNEHDSERMKGMLESLGYREAPEREQANLILFNTCSIRESADSRLIAHLGQARRLNREQPEREVSRPPEELVAEAETMAADGVSEVTLLGQNVNSYGRDLPTRTGSAGERVRATFARLLTAIDAVEGVQRIRYTSPHPKDMREDVIRAHAQLPSLCEHIHLPLQSGSSRILKAMRRTYDRRRYLERVALIREHVPDASLTTDIIVGFPGETKDDFAQTLLVVEEVGYDGAFTFVFSPRRGTEAATMSAEAIPHAVKVERMQRLVEVVQRRARERAQRFVGRTL